MIKVNEKLTVLHSDNAVFADYSTELAGFDRDTANITFVTAEDSIYVGFEKPINVFYTEMSTANTNSATLSVKYYNGSAFTDVAGLHDDSAAFNRSGFTSWDRNQTDEAKTTINSVETYWYKVDLSVDSSAMVIAGLNIVFSDDQDLKRELYEADKYLPSGATSHILSHVAARDEIIQNLNIMGKDKKNASTGWIEDITAFDLLDVSEAKLASTYLTLAKILFAVSDDTEDIYGEKASSYRKMGMNILSSMKLSVDYDDDGLDDQTERDSVRSGTIVRL